MMEDTLVPYNWKEYIFHRIISWNSQSVVESGLILGGKENDKARQAVFFTPVDPFGNNPVKRNLMMITLFFRKHTTELIGNSIKMQYIGKNHPERRIKDCNSGKQNHLRSSPVPECHETAFTE